MIDEYLSRPIPEWFVPIHRGKVDRSQRNLPHWTQPGATYFITFRLADSIPEAARARLRILQQEWLNENPRPWNLKTEKEYQRRFSDRTAQILDAGHGTCILRNPTIREIVRDAILHFNEIRYHIDSFTIMPNHVHVMACPTSDYAVSSVLHSWKSFTSNKICKQYGINPPLWMDERWDHIIRNQYYFIKYRTYIFNNPIKAKLPSNSFTVWPS